MAKRWYVVHTYSGYENKVKTDLEHRIETYGLERAVADIQIPTEEVTEVTAASARPKSPRFSQVTFLFAWSWMTILGLLFATPQA